MKRTIKNHFTAAALMATTMLLVACSPSTPDSSGKTDDSQPAATTAASGPATITMVPQNLPCAAGGGPIVATIRWQAPAAAQIWVHDSKAEKLWAAVPPSGERQSGKWVVPGTRFSLKDTASGETLAEVSAGATANCRSEN